MSSYSPQPPEKSHLNGSVPPIQQPMGHQDMSYQPQPGNSFQIHSQQQTNKWTFGFWDCFRPFGTSCLGCWCPCILFGRTDARVSGDPHLQSHSDCNGPCVGYTALMACTGFQCIYQGLRRTDKKRAWGIEDGNGFMDFCGACCCPCCGLVQEEKEALLRNAGVDVRVKEEKGKGYEKRDQMNYQA